MKDTKLNNIKLNNNLREAINYWKNLNKTYERILIKFQGLILIANIIIERPDFLATIKKQGSSQTKIAEDFIAGIILSVIANKKKKSDKNINKINYAIQLMQPIIDEITKLVKSDDYNKFLINQITDDDEVINIGNVKIPLTTSKINKFRKRIVQTNLNIEDARETVKAFIAEKEKTFLKPMQSNVVVTGEVAALFAYFLVEAKIISGTSQRIAEMTINHLNKMNIVSHSNKPFSPITIQRRYNDVIGTNGKAINKILNYDNNKSVLPLLKEYPEAKKLAQNQLESYEII